MSIDDHKEDVKNNNNNNNNNEGNGIDSIITLSSVWLSGKDKKYPTIHITPISLAKKYNLDKPCRITIQGDLKRNGILIKRFYDPDSEDQ